MVKGDKVDKKKKRSYKVIPHRRALTLRAAKGLCPFGIPESSNPVPRAQGVIGNKIYSFGTTKDALLCSRSVDSI